MKSLMAIVLVSSLVLNESSISAISKALSTGDADSLSDFFDREITLGILDQEGIYSKEEASQLLQDFFSKNAAQSFVQMHQGKSKGQDSQYCIGNLKAGNTTYRVYIYMKVENGRYIIQELRFNRE